MIKINIDKSFLETYFKNQVNFKQHYDKHILHDFDYDLQMDNMTKEIYDELGNRLSLAKAGKWNSKTDQILGYISQNGLTTKFDTKSGLCVVYSYEDDETVSLYKTFLKKFQGKADPFSDKNSDFKYLSDIPDEQNGTGTFDYEEFIKEFKVEHRKEFSINPRAIATINIFVPDEKMEMIRKLYSKNSLSIKTKNPYIQLDYIGRIDTSDYDRLDKVKKEISLLGSEMKFKIIGYANNGKVEAVKVKLKGVPSELSDIIDIKDDYILMLSREPEASNLDANLLEFNEVQQKIQLSGILGARKKDKTKAPIFTPKDIISESYHNKYIEIILD